MKRRQPTWRGWDEEASGNDEEASGNDEEASGNGTPHHSV
jgi:hypothetical protein